jgi:hypothetical protein
VRTKPLHGGLYVTFRSQMRADPTDLAALFGLLSADANATIESFNGRFREECLNITGSRYSRMRSRRSTPPDGTTMSIILTELKGLSAREFARRAVTPAADSSS